MADITRGPHEHGPHEHGPEINPQVSHERRDVNVFQISAFGIGLLLACIVTVFAMWGLFDYFYQRENEKNTANPVAGMMSERQKLPPEPRLQATPRLELKDLRADEDAILNSYGWIDPNRGIIRIPISVAMDMVAAKGLPSKPTPAGSDNEGFRMIPEDSSSGRTLEKISQ